MTVYLLHFGRQYQHAQHYLGFAEDLEKRLEAHRTGQGAKLTQAVVEAGITLHLVRIWDGDRQLERQLKDLKNSPRLCPLCNSALPRSLIPTRKTTDPCRVPPDLFLEQC